MTDREREHIDTEAQNIIKKCQDSLNTVKKNGKVIKGRVYLPSCFIYYWPWKSYLLFHISKIISLLICEI
jgi:hypothetical protein